MATAGVCQFQIRALGVLGYTDWMDTKTFVVAQQRCGETQFATKGRESLIALRFLWFFAEDSSFYFFRMSAVIDRRYSYTGETSEVSASKRRSRWIFPSVPYSRNTAPGAVNRR
jgi:hypothetical protein